MTTLKRNDIVIPYRGGLYGRVLRVTREGLIVVVHYDSVMYYHENEIKKTTYKGGYRWGHHPDNERGKPVRFSYMTSLRKLKQQASRYNPRVWRKLHHKVLENDETIPFDLVNTISWHVCSHGRVYGGNHFLGKRLTDHNMRRRYILDDILITKYNAYYKPLSVRGRNWEILKSTDMSNTVQIKQGDPKDILHDLTLMRIAI